MSGSTDNLTHRKPGNERFDNPAFSYNNTGTSIDSGIGGEPVDPSHIRPFTIEDGGIPPEAEKVEKRKGCCARGVGAIQDGLSNFYKSHYNAIWCLIYLVLLLAYGAYLSYALYYSFGDEASIRLLACTCVVVFFTTLGLINQNCGKVLYERLIEPMVRYFDKDPVGTKVWKITKWIAMAIVVVLIIFFLVYEVGMREPYNLVSLCGIAAYILICYVFSYNPAKVRWRPVVMGLLLQFVFALMILRTYWGYAAFKWLGDRVTEFLDHTDAGSQFVFGDKQYLLHFFAMKVLPVIIFFSTAISILYYLGWMQVVIKKVAWVMQVTMGTTAAESLNAAGNIFIGQSEAPLLIRPLIQNMTKSEIHAVMTGGFATIAGSVLAAYISFGVPADHLLSASVMSAPAALAMSKLFYPETEVSKTTSKDVVHMEKSPERNIIEAAASGASKSISLVANVAVNLIAFIALLDFVNDTLIWFGARVGIKQPEYPPFTFQFICSYVLYPLAVMMGADLQDCGKLAELIGIKTFINEFVAYSVLGGLIKNRAALNNYTSHHNETWVKRFDDIYLPATNTTLVGGVLTERSEVIATYTLCGFANFGSIGIMIGCLGAMAPHRQSDVANVALRAMIAGNVACFMTACIAGLLYTPQG